LIDINTPARPEIYDGLALGDFQLGGSDAAPFP
jgi:hypothetical protein